MKDINYEYDNDLDIFNIYSAEIKEGVKGCISIGYFTIDISPNNKIVGVEIEEASKLFKVSPEVLLNPDNVDLIIRNESNMLLIGISLNKGMINSHFQFNLPSQRVPLTRN